MTNEILIDFLRNYEIKSICSICVENGFFLQLDEQCPSYLSCMRDNSKHKFECNDYSGFKMKRKLDWYKFRVANMRTGKWEFYRIANYKDGEFINIEIKKVGRFE